MIWITKSFQILLESAIIADMREGSFAKSPVETCQTDKHPLKIFPENSIEYGKDFGYSFLKISL